MIECFVCGENVDEEDVFYECPFCGEMVNNDVLWRCESCDTILDWQGIEWECPYCQNTGIADDDSEEMEEVETCPECGSEDYDGYCYECGYPNNQGWIGENY